ncbi:Histone H2A.Z-specific chaperone CHZ1 [Sporothrix bragantina]|uniref:Histone H2A.Z-specific chaperone CHZ1 n=1 Tax=Sporothrix bragantina TaxID=671064 RepID=A0ABP0AQ07_9PEZI
MASNGNGVQDPTLGAGAQAVTETSDFKGKGKAVAPEDDDMKDAHDDDDDDDDDDDEDAAENDDDDDDDDGDDDLQQQGINLSNVIGRRTRGVVIDYAKAAAENPVDEDEDEEDDGDFEEPDDMEED